MTRGPRRAGDRRQRLQQALQSENALAELRELVDESTPAGSTVRFAFACLLETNAAGLTILFDRFDEGELAEIEDALQAIGAAHTLADYRALEQRFEEAVASGMDPVDASEALEGTPECRAIAHAHEAHVDEMERQLLAFCRAHLHEL